MGNWSSVILTWTRIDGKAKDVTKRLSEIDALADLGNRRTAWQESNFGQCCEVVAVASIEGFWPYPKDYEPNGPCLMNAIAFLEWEFPQEVQVFWKDEDANRYQVISYAKESP